MATTCQLNTDDKEHLYKFRFGSTKKCIELNKEELDLIPYLSLHVTYDQIFESSQNENGEYLLDSRIRLNYFRVILNCLKMKDYSILFTELSEKANVLGMLQLYDYLCLDPIPIPFLKNQHLSRAKDNQNEKSDKSIKYQRTNLLETREIAVQFVISFTKNEHNIDDSQTLQTIFSLLMIILSNSNIFSVPLCRHTWTAIKTYCFSLFSQEQQNQLDKAQRSVQTYNNIQTLPEYFDNAFTWKGVFMPDQEKPKPSPSEEFRWLFNDIDTIDYLVFTLPIDWDISLDTPFSLFDKLILFDWFDHYHLTHRAAQIKQIEKEREAKSARSGRFNTLPKRPKVDKFKYQYPRKFPKYP